MKKLKSIAVLIVSGLLIILIGRFSISQEAPGEVVMDEPCTRCHTCSNPTPEKPCLPVCARYAIEALLVKERSALTEIEETIVISEYQNVYAPVYFSHHSHAQMSLMDKGCGTCHHKSPPGKNHPPCKACHDPSVNKQNLNIIRLKAAYHQQCLNCHISWNGTKNCDVCHPLKGSKAAEAVKQGGKTYDFPTRKPSETIVFLTGFVGKSKKVTFPHKEHTDTFGFDCSYCHQNQPCNLCHNPKTYGQKIPKTTPAFASCSTCHSMSECSKCHLDGGTYKTFNHATTGTPLIKFHQKLDCRKCHRGTGHFTRLNKQCSNCHGSWNQDNFDHSIIGIKLNEFHSQFECTECHENRQYDLPVTCVKCHNETYKYPQKIPGTKVKGKY